MRIIRSFINITANDAVIQSLDNYLNDCDFHDITSFVQAFYNDAAVNDNGVSNKWSLDNVGSKWIYLYDYIHDGYFSVESALYYPDKFISHLYRLLSPYDEDLTIEIKWQDETMSNIGVVLVAKDGNGVYRFYESEVDDITNPLNELNSDDENYDTIQEEFMLKIMDIQDELYDICKDKIMSGQAINWEDAITYN
jgi:hypothetical protein